jgi:CheY-like chemotaxis protein
MREVVTAGADVWRHLISQKNQRLTIDIASDEIYVDADPTRLTQVIANLVHNAAKFTPAGGSITVRAATENGRAVLRVSDDGVGMTRDVLAHAFELFVQGPPPLDRQQGGLGLGLTLVRTLVEMHGGNVMAASDGPGRGTEVVVTLPLAQAPARVASPLEHRALTSPVRRRVLIVEDNADARAMLTILLKRNGQEVRAVEDGFAALREAEIFGPDLVLLDVGLPGMNGYEVARALRSSPHTSDVVLVALTGYGQAEDREKALAAGFDEHLLKPAEPAAVLALLQRTRTRVAGEAG